MDIIIGALIAALVALGTACLGVWHYFKQRQRELKETVYIEYVQHLQQHQQCLADLKKEMQGKDRANRQQQLKITEEARQAFAASTARLYLLGCEKVVNALFEFNAIKVSGKGENHDKKQAIYDQLVKKMRKDLGLSSNKKHCFSVQTIE